MNHATPLLLRCPICDRLGNDALIRDGRYHCACGSATFAREPGGLGTTEERRRSAERLRSILKLDLPSVYAVQLQMMSVREARRLHADRLAQLPHVARRLQAEPGATPRGRTQDRARRPSPPPGGSAPSSIRAKGSAGRPRQSATAPASRRPAAAPASRRPAVATAPKIRAPRRPPSARSHQRRTARGRRRPAKTTQRWYRDVLATIALMFVIGVVGSTVNGIHERVTTPKEKLIVSDRAVMRAGFSGEPIEIRASAPEHVLRRYCNVAGCRGLELAMPAWLPSHARLGVFETPNGTRAAIRIDRSALNEWCAGSRTEGIQVLENPLIPPKTPTIRVAG